MLKRDQSSILGVEIMELEEKIDKIMNRVEDIYTIVSEAKQKEDGKIKFGDL